MGFNCIFDDVNWSLAFGFERCFVGTAPAVGSLITARMGMVGMKVEWLLSSIQDFAALAVARCIRRLPESGCMMHNTDKIMRYATGLAVYSRGGVAINTCPVAVALITALRAYAIHFSYSERLAALHAICTVLSCAALKISIDKNKTRISPLRRLLLSLLVRMTPALKSYRNQNPAVAVAQVTDEQFQAGAEIEAVASVVATVTTLAQTENGFAGGYKTVLYQHLARTLHPTTGLIPVLDIGNMTSAAKPPRRPTSDVECTPIGRGVWYRAYAEVFKRVQLPGAAVSDADLIAFGQDIRLVACATKFLSADGVAKMTKLTKGAYVAYVVQVKRSEHAAKIVPKPDAPAATATPSTATATPIVIDFSDESDDDAADGVIFDVELAMSAAALEFDRAWPHWTAVAAKIPWSTFIPGLEVKPFADYDLIYDLLDAPMAQIYTYLEGHCDKSGRRFAKLPRFAKTRIGNLLASSYCERMISAGNLVMPKGRTVLSDDLLHKVVLLKMNRKFMEHMKKTYPQLASEMVAKYEKALIAHLSANGASTVAPDPAPDPAAAQDPAAAEAAAAATWDEVMNFARGHFAPQPAEPQQPTEPQQPVDTDEDYTRILEETDMSILDDANLAHGLQDSYDAL